MAGAKWYVVVSYDVVEDKRRAKMAKVLKGYGERVQKSVFDCLLSEAKLLELQAKLLKVMDQGTDSVRYYKLCANCERTIEVQGWGTVQEDEDIIIV